MKHLIMKSRTSVRSIVEFVHPKTKKCCIALGLYNTIEIFDIDSGKSIHRWMAHDDFVIALLCTSDGKLVSGSYDGFVKKWDVTSFKKYNINAENDINGANERLWATDLDHAHYAFVVFELDKGEGKGRLIVSGANRAVRILDGTTGHEIIGFSIVAFGPNGEFPTSAIIKAGFSLSPPSSSLFCSYHALSKKISSFALISKDGAVHEYFLKSSSDPLSCRKVAEVKEPVFAGSISQCGQFVAAGCEFGSLHLFKTREWKSTVWSIKAHESVIYSVAWSPDSKKIITGSDDNLIKIFDRTTGDSLANLKVHSESKWINFVHFSNDGTKIYSGSGGRWVCTDVFAEQDSRVASFVSSLFSLFVLDMDFYDGLIELHSFLNPLMVDSFFSPKKN